MNNVFEKFKDFALTKEQTSQVRGGSGWTCHFFRNGQPYTDTWYSSTGAALAACDGNVDLGGVYCAGCEPSDSLTAIEEIDNRP